MYWLSEYNGLLSIEHTVLYRTLLLFSFLCYKLVGDICLQEHNFTVAVKRGDVDLVRGLLKEDVNVNHKDWVCVKYIHVVTVYHRVQGTERAILLCHILGRRGGSSHKARRLQQEL